MGFREGDTNGVYDSASLYCGTTRSHRSMPVSMVAQKAQGNTEHQLERMERSHSAVSILGLRFVSG